MPMQGTFDARQFEPQQGMGTHPDGTFDAVISGTAIKPTKDNNGGYVEIEFTTQVGMIKNNYNLWNQSPQAVQISQKELSALCYATGIFNLDWTNDGAALRGARCKIVVGKQDKGEYKEVKRVLDINGNEPGKAPQQQPQGQTAVNQQWNAPAQQQPNPQPQGQAPNPSTQSWGQPAPNVGTNPAPNGWNNPQPNNGPAPANNQPTQNAPQGWTQGAPSGNPPWGGPR